MGKLRVPRASVALGNNPRTTKRDAGRLVADMDAKALRLHDNEREGGFIAGVAATLTDASTPGTNYESLVDGEVNLGSSTLTLDGDEESGFAIRGTNLNTSILTNDGSAPVLKQRASGGNYARRGMRLSDLYVLGSVQVNEPTDIVNDDENATRVYLNGCYERVLFAEPTGSTDVGTVVSWTKVFNSSLRNCLVAGGDTGLHLNGCDNNTIHTTRVSGFRKFGVLETSAQSLGSSNALHDTEILGAVEKADAYFKSSGHHVRMYNGYMEPGVGGLKTFIDLTDAGMPDLSPNVTFDFVRKSIVLRDNRIDSQQVADDYIYKVDDQYTLTCRIEGIQTSNNSTKTSTFVKPDGVTPTEILPVHVPGVGRAYRRYIEENTFGAKWDGFRAKQGVTVTADGGFLITAENVWSLPFNTLVSTGAGVASCRGQMIVLEAGKANQDIPIVPDGTGPLGTGLGYNDYFADGKLYIAEVMARSSAAGDTLTFQFAGLTDTSDGFGQPLQTKPLTTQFKRLRFDFTGVPRNYKQAGFNIRSATSTGNIEFAVSWREVIGYWDAPEKIGTFYYWTDDTNAAAPKLRTKNSGLGLPENITDGTLVADQVP